MKVKRNAFAAVFQSCHNAEGTVEINSTIQDTDDGIQFNQIKHVGGKITPILSKPYIGYVKSKVNKILLHRWLIHIFCFVQKHLLIKMQWTLSWRRPLSYRNQFIDLRNKLMDWFLYDNGRRHERVNNITRSSYDSHISLNQYGGEILSNLLKFQCSPSL